MNRIYVKSEEVAKSMYRRKKERCFTTEDVMRLHWNRQGHDALEWARLRIKRLREDGLVENLTKEEALAHTGDKRRVLYRFTEAALQQWGLDK